MIEAEFLAAIAAAPDDDTPRLAYADWLDDQGRARKAEFIRVGCEVAYKKHQPHQPDKFVGLWQRQQELIDYYLADVIGPLANAVEQLEYDFERGFMTSVRVPVEVFLTDGAELAACRPLPRIHVTEVGGAFTSFLRSPYLHVVHGIRGTAESLVETLPTLTARDIEDVARGCAALTRLKILDLENCGVDDASLAVLAQNAPPQLDDLDLADNYITVAGVHALIESPLARRLQRLVVGSNPLTDQAAFEIADRWPRDGNLKYLNLRFVDIGSAGHAALTARFGGMVDLF